MYCTDTNHMYDRCQESSSLFLIILVQFTVTSTCHVILPVMHETSHNEISCFHIPSADPEKPPKKDSFELLQDFCMPTRIKKIWESRDRNFIFLLGEYPSQIKCLDVHQMSMKYSRFFRDEAIDGISLSDDYRKFAVLMRHRNLIEFHDQNGVHTTIRTKAQPNALFLNPLNDQILLPSFDTNAIERLCLKEGTKLPPYDITSKAGSAKSVGAQAICTLTEHNLDLVGCEDGVIRCFLGSESEGTQAVAPLSCATLPDGLRAPITAITADPHNGFQFVVGTAAGNILLYDMRKSVPLLVKNHCNELPIKKIAFHLMDSFSRSLSGAGAGHLICSMDSRSMHIWDDAQGETLTVVEPFTAPSGRESKSVFDYTYRASTPPSIHDFAFIAGDAQGTKHSGLIMLGMEQSAGYGLFVPHLGPAPRWCGYLDRLAAEKQDKPAADEVSPVQQEFVFISQDEFAELGLSPDKAGVDVIRPIMNGYLIDHTHLRFLRNALEASKPYQKATKGSKLVKKLKKQDPITPVEPIRRKKKVKKDAAIDSRFASRMESELYAVEGTEKHAKAAADAKRNVAYDSMFASVDGLDSESGPRTMRLQQNANFYAADADIAQSYELGQLKASRPLKEVAAELKKRKGK